jgi:hypothetical protein
VPTSRVRWVAPAALALLLAGCGDDRPTPEIAQEYPEPDEAEVTRELIELAREASEEARKEAGSDGPSAGRMLRFNQPRHAGCLRADFTVAADLPDELRVGVFVAPRAFPAWIRFASATDTPDTKKDFRGMSIKLMQVDGNTLLGGGNASGETHDFVLNSHPVLFVGTPEDFRDFVDYNLNSSPLLFFLNPFNPHLKELRIVRAGRQHHASHLSIPYWSTTPYLFGEGRAVKYAAMPCDRNREWELPDELTDGYLRDAMREQLANEGVCFDFMVQFQLDAEQMPVEDATVDWDEALSPFRTVARIDIPAQSFESPRQMAFCENLAFNPWRSLPEHRPLGGINRVRKSLYQELAKFRHQRNGVTYTEPTGDEIF